MKNRIMDIRAEGSVRRAKRPRTRCRKIKEDPILKHPPVALFASLITDKLEHKGAFVGADARFAKSDLRILSRKVMDLMATRKERGSPAVMK